MHVQEQDFDVVVKYVQGPVYYLFQLPLRLLDPPQGHLQLGNRAVLVQQLLPVAEVEVGEGQGFFLLLKQVLVEFPVYLHVPRVAVLLVELEEKPLDQHVI